MALTGIEIFKLLPKTNCGDCGVPTCLAFAMNLAAGKAELEKCPHVSEEAREKLSEAAAPPIRPVTIGVGEGALKTGGETVLFRHEKTFVHPTGIAVLVADDMSEEEVASRLEKLRELRYERVGLILRPELVAARSRTGDPGRFRSLAEHIATGDAHPLILMSERPDVLGAACEVVGDRRPLLYAATESNAGGMVELAKSHHCPLAVRADGLEALAALTEKLMAAGVKDLVLDSGARTLDAAFRDQVYTRRAALLEHFRPLGFPTITFPCEMTDDPLKEAAIASIFIAKYGGLIVLSHLREETIFPLLVERMNIFTDPQRPMATAQGIYPIGDPDEDSPVLITTNFSLTYFIVKGEIETSRIPAWLLIMDCEGLSVMTAWAAGKFVGDLAGTFVKKSGIAEKVRHREIIIPGYAAMILGDMEEELPDWKIVIGPREASVIPAFLKQRQVA